MWLLDLRERMKCDVLDTIASFYFLGHLCEVGVVPEVKQLVHN